MALPRVDLPRLMAHRGLSAHAPENTLAAIRAAHAAGFEWVELDVQLLGDGTPVIWHDPGMRRCSDGRGKLSKLRLEQAREFDVGAWFADGFRGERMATLDETLAVMAELGMGLNLELKVARGRDPEALAESAIPRLLEALPYERRLVSSFSPAALEHSRSLADASSLALGVLCESLPRGWQAQVDAIQAYSIHCDWKRLKEKRARQISEAGIALLCYTANDPLAFKSRWDWGVAGVISDDPGRFIAAGISQQ
ncbi:glycerophosphodiester phosphodiesterase family protein [Halomonas huangheensis]|uniref:GP-PDE domain-containing protein n=1 Tax=Halomonas huangheensis TaxID=1178482 RepID=W1N8Z0_9GAMM|nr:glycerophosphodiester phosphodiesterase family protein [Halomonas huangheensis]ALM53066.1 glycerophosphodiester phosphodiesterase [Halomonas huangheensis]ERL51375.1 hypothetical protein BJB45_14380 [Halomonas huangheensis]